MNGKIWVTKEQKKVLDYLLNHYPTKLVNEQHIDGFGSPRNRCLNELPRQVFQHAMLFGYQEMNVRPAPPILFNLGDSIHLKNGSVIFLHDEDDMKYAELKNSQGQIETISTVKKVEPTKPYHLGGCY